MVKFVHNHFTKSIVLKDVKLMKGHIMSNNKPSILNQIATTYSTSLAAGFEDHGIFIGSIVLVWNTVKFAGILLAYGLTGGLAVHGWLRTNSATYNTVNSTGVFEIAAQDTLETIAVSATTDYDNTAAYFGTNRRRIKEREAVDTDALNVALNGASNAN